MAHSVQTIPNMMRDVFLISAMMLTGLTTTADATPHTTPTFSKSTVSDTQQPSRLVTPNAERIGFAGTVTTNSFTQVEPAPTAAQVNSRSFKVHRAIDVREKQPRNTALNVSRPNSRAFLVGARGPSSNLVMDMGQDQHDRRAADHQSQPLDQKAIARAMSHHKGALEHCVRQQLKRSGLRKSRVTLRFQIHPSGRTVQPRIDRNLRATRLSKCMIASVERWRFPRFSGDAIDVEYPMELTVRY